MLNNFRCISQSSVFMTNQDLFGILYGSMLSGEFIMAKMWIWGQDAKAHFIKKALLGFHKVMDRHKIPYWLDFGTLLGAIREGKIIEWDGDGDIGVWIEDLDKMKELQKEFMAEDLQIYYQDSHAYLNLKVAKNRWEAIVDIYTYKKVSHNGQDWVVRIENGKMFDIRGPYEHFEWRVLVPFLDTMFPVPCMFIESLEFLYGPEWKTPIRREKEAYKVPEGDPEKLNKVGRSGRKRWKDVE